MTQLQLLPLRNEQGPLVDGDSSELRDNLDYFTYSRLIWGSQEEESQMRIYMVVRGSHLPVVHEPPSQ